MNEAEIIYQHFLKLEDKLKISIDDCDIIETKKSKLNETIEDTENRLKVKLKNGKCSKFLIEQISKHRLNIGEEFNKKIEFYNASEIIDLIGLLENNKIDYDNFVGDTLKGFSKIHHGTFSRLGYSIIRNIKEFWYKKGRIRNERDNDFKTILSKSENITVIARTMHYYALKNKDLKGEWLIFKKENNYNTYLCLATHNEKDEYILENKINKHYIL